jgi:ribonuclease-3
MNARVVAIEALERRLGYGFKDRRLLERALTHASVGDGAAKPGLDNERLEFLGDRVLGLLTAERLIQLDPAASEGDLAPRLNALVNRKTCARVARAIALGPALRLSGAETRTGGRDKDSILGDACEALIAALYQDAGLDETRRIFLDIWSAEFQALGAPRPKDPKTRLQEWAQGRGRPVPVYAVVQREGPEHAPVFTVKVTVEGHGCAQGQGSSRQTAEKSAAQALMDQALIDREGAQ